MKKILNALDPDWEKLSDQEKLDRIAAVKAAADKAQEEAVAARAKFEEQKRRRNAER
jgi:hypothetical protein